VWCEVDRIVSNTQRETEKQRECWRDNMASLLAAGRWVQVQQERRVLEGLGARGGGAMGDQGGRGAADNNGNKVTVGLQVTIYQLGPVTGACWQHLPVVRLSSILPFFLRPRGGGTTQHDPTTKVWMHVTEIKLSTSETYLHVASIFVLPTKNFLRILFLCSYFSLLNLFQ
jgi:hypothetical protein